MTEQNTKEINNEVKNQFQKFLNKIKEEWKKGYKLLKKNLEKIENISDLCNQKPTYIRDPLWGEITLNKLERILLDSFFIQRLRNIRVETFFLSIGLPISNIRIVLIPAKVRFFCKFFVSAVYHSPISTRLKLSCSAP